MDTDQSEMASIQPDELPSLLSASQTGGLSGGVYREAVSLQECPDKGLGASGADASGLSMSPDSSLGSSLGSPFGSSIGSLLGSQNGVSGFPQQARLEDQNRFPLQQYSYPKPPQQPMLRHRPNPYADVPSLYDLYAQYSRRTPRLERFGEDVFLNGTGNLDDFPWIYRPGQTMSLAPATV